MGRNDGFVDVADVFHQKFDLLSIYVGEAIAGGVWDIDHGGTRLDDGFDHFGQVDVVGAAGVFGVEFHVVHKFAGVLHTGDGSFQNVVLVGIEFVLDVVIGGSDTGVDTTALGILEGFGSHFDVFLNGAGQGTDYRPGYSLADLNHRVKVPGTRNRKTGLNDIDPQVFQGLGHLYLFYGIQLAAGHLFAVPERGVKHVNFLGHGLLCFWCYSRWLR